MSIALPAPAVANPSAGAVSIAPQASTARTAAPPAAVSFQAAERTFRSKRINHRHANARITVHVRKRADTLPERDRASDEACGLQLPAADHLQHGRIAMCLHAVTAENRQLLGNHLVHRQDGSIGVARKEDRKSVV